MGASLAAGGVRVRNEESSAVPQRAKFQPLRIEDGDQPWTHHGGGHRCPQTAL